MKILKYILLILLLLILFFFAIGMIKKSVSYGHEVTVSKSIEEAWAVHQDPANLKLWLKGFKSIELISGKEGTVGSKYKVIVDPGEGQEEFDMIETIISIKENDHMTFTFDSDMMVFDQTTSFSESEGNTTIKTKSVAKGKGIIMRSMFGVMEMLGGSFTKQEVENIEALKKVIESNTRNYFPIAEPEQEVINN